MAGRKNTIYGAYDISLKEEIQRIIENLKKLGIKKPTILEVTALIAQKNKRAKMSEKEVRLFFEQERGLR
jgi:hypothetical protein